MKINTPRRRSGTGRTESQLLPRPRSRRGSPTNHPLPVRRTGRLAGHWTLDADGRLACAWSLERSASSDQLSRRNAA